MQNASLGFYITVDDFTPCKGGCNHLADLEGLYKAL